VRRKLDAVLARLCLPLMLVIAACGPTEPPHEPTGWSDVPLRVAPDAPSTSSRWRGAIEHYEPSVKLDNTTRLGSSISAFATYLVIIHKRIHPIFAEDYIARLPSAPMGPRVYTSLEVVIDGRTGNVIRSGVTKTSGITDFDIVALESVDRAQPFGPAPDLIRSPDGNVYVHWEFHRDPFDACTTRNARPFLLKAAPVAHP
jgi:hypothetical protein